MPSTEYRLWDEDQREFVYFDLRRLVGHWSEIIFDPEESSTQSGGHEGIADLLKNAPLMQFTNLRDKNDKMIFDGDIVRHHTNAIGEVKFGKYVTDNELNDDVLAWVVELPLRWAALDPQGTWEIIGNIYENPELLGRGRDG